MTEAALRTFAIAASGNPFCVYTAETEDGAVSAFVADCFSEDAADVLDADIQEFRSRIEVEDIVISEARWMSEPDIKTIVLLLSASDRRSTRRQSTTIMQATSSAMALIHTSTLTASRAPAAAISILGAISPRPSEKQCELPSTLRSGPKPPDKKGDLTAPSRLAAVEISIRGRGSPKQKSTAGNTKLKLGKTNGTTN
ncbi:hypothetical protein [Sinorhizobium fredii]|uniref:hypothetical protein n=1 Tax=Rhizobium fredii TaxID=380 RepID=UPI003512B44D